MGLLAIAAMGSMALMTGMMRANRDARLRGQAAALARETIDQFLTVTAVASSPQQFATAVNEIYTYNGGPDTSTHGVLERKVRTVENGEMLEVYVTIGWERQSGTNTTYEFFAEIARPN